MATAKDWHGDVAVQEQQKPVPPYSKYVAIKSFPGETPHDLAFNVGEIITVLEPCNVVFWYLGENSAGRRGVVPINFLEPCGRKRTLVTKSSSHRPPPLPPKEVDTPPPRPPKTVKPTTPKLPGNSSPPVLSPILPKNRYNTIQPPRKATVSGNGFSSLPRQLPPPPTATSHSYLDIDSRPPAPLPPEASPTPKSPEPIVQAKYRSQVEFMKKSGWFSPNLETVLCRKMGNVQLSVVSANLPGVYYFANREHPNRGYTAKSKDAFHEMAEMFHQLYDKPHDKLSPLEMELKYNLPDAKGWVIRLLTVADAETLDSQETWSIIIHRSLRPDGLNPKVTFKSKEHFYEFAEKYAKKIREKNSRSAV